LGGENYTESFGVKEEGAVGSGGTGKCKKIVEIRLCESINTRLEQDAGSTLLKPCHIREIKLKNN